MGTFDIGLQVVVLGIGLVTIVLILLIGAINVLNKFSNLRMSRPVINEIDNVNTLELTGANDNELVAVITAAVYAILSSDNQKSNLDFVVRSIKRI